MVEYSKYPSQIDSSSELPLATDNITPVKAEVVNRLRSAILAIESELGVDPSRDYGTVRARLDALESSGTGGGSIEILLDGVQVLPSVIGIDFIGNVFVSSSQPLRAQVEVIGGQATQVQETITVSTGGQTSFTLSDLPIQDSGLMMYVNGVKQQRGVDYTSFNTLVTYSGITLTTSDKVEFWYLVEVGDIHAHGNQLGGTLHSVATELEAGFMSAADKVEHNLIANIVDSSGLTFSEDQTSITFAQTQDLTASGASWLIRAQKGFAGFIGGTLTIGGGDGGTGGTNLAGETIIQLGQTVSNVSASLRIKADSSTLATFRQSASGTLELDCGANALNILATGGVSIKIRYTTFTSGTASLVADTINLLTSTTSAATLPAASTWSGFTITVKKVNIAGDIVVSRSGSDTIDGATTYTITGAYGTASFASDGTNIYAFPAA